MQLMQGCSYLFSHAARAPVSADRRAAVLPPCHGPYAGTAHWRRLQLEWQASGLPARGRELLLWLKPRPLPQPVADPSAAGATHRCPFSAPVLALLRQPQKVQHCRRRRRQHLSQL